MRLLSDRIDLEMPVVGSDTALEEQARRATCLSSACRPTRLPASARRRSRPDVKRLLGKIRKLVSGRVV